MARVFLKCCVVCLAIILIAPATGCGGGGSNTTPPPPPATTYTLTVNTSNPPSNVSISVSPSDNGGNGNGTSGTLTRTYNSGSTVTLIAPTTSGSNTFDSWQGCSTKNTTTCTVNLTANTTVTAYYVSPVPTVWNLTWSDDFSGVAGSSPDGTKWGYDLGASGWGNNEKECYTSSTSNAYLDGTGNLVIEAKSAQGTICSDSKTANFTSARLLTKGKFSQAYGKIEARIKLPYGQGIWPAFWGLGDNIDSVSWPACGEMDIMESVTTSPLGRTKIESSLHSPSFDIGQPVDLGANVDADYHVYGVIWTPNQVQYYVDDPTKPFVTFTPAKMGNTGVWAFNHPFFLILNVAVGGNWPGDPDGTTFSNPQKMVVDYVRVYDSNTISR